MDAKQKQTIEMFVRVQAFLAGHPALEPASYAIPKQALDDAVRQLRDYAGTQVSARTLSSTEVRRVEMLVKRLVDRHIRPIVTISQDLASADGENDVRMPELKLPKTPTPVTKLIAEADGLIKAAEPYEAILIQNGRPADFLAQMRIARAEIEYTLGGRAAQVRTQIGATKGIQVQLRRGRTAVKRIDSVVRIAFEGNEVVLREWRAAKRVFLLPVPGDQPVPLLPAA